MAVENIYDTLTDEDILLLAVDALRGAESDHARAVAMGDDANLEFLWSRVETARAAVADQEAKVKPVAPAPPSEREPAS